MRKAVLIQPAVLLVCTVLLCNPAEPAGVRQNDTSGLFEYIALAVDSERGIVSGCFESHTGWDDRSRSPRFSCRFFFSGKKAGDRYLIAIRQPGVLEHINGWLRLVDPEEESKLYLKLHEIPPGCGNVYPFDLEKGDYFARESRETWLEVRGIAAARAYFHTRPESAAREKRYVVQDDVIKVLSRAEGWVLAEFSGEKIVKGWLRSSDLYPIAPIN